MYDRLKPTNFSTPNYSKKNKKEVYLEKNIIFLDLKVSFSNFKGRQLFEKS